MLILLKMLISLIFIGYSLDYEKEFTPLPVFNNSGF